MTIAPEMTQWEGTLEELKHLVSPQALTGETVLLNMGPQHPSTHGVLRLLLELEGETIINVVPDIGYLHTGIEKNMESKWYEQSVVMTDRMDYLAPMSNNLAYCLAIEKLVDLDVPERAQIIRVLLAELTRLNSHLVWLGTHAIDIGAMSMLLYTFREREYILDMFEMVSGQRMMSTYFRPGGVWRDLTDEFLPAVEKFLDYLPGKIDEYEALLTHNPLWIDRTQGIGIITPDDAIAMGLGGAILRASGVNFDVRKAIPYTGYETYDFDVPLGLHGDIYDRYLVRMQEMRQSMRIIRQAVDRVRKAEGPFRSENAKFVPPARSELGQSMEAVIHHFKLWTEGFKAPKGEVHVMIESPRGVIACYLSGDGTNKPHRVHFRTPSFINIQAIPMVAHGHLVGDMVAIIGTMDPVLGDCDR
jgi:NADH-quinone oxidoreductase subunit D